MANKNNAIAITGIVSAAIVLVALGFLIFGADSGSSNIGGNELNVQGQATVKAMPDLVTVYFRAETNASTAQEAKDLNSEITDELITNLVKLGFERDEIVTENFNVYQEYDWTEDEGRIAKGFKATHSIKVEIDKFQNVYLPPEKAEYKNLWMKDIFVNAMNVSEVFAEKIRAASGRARYRDFYDMVLLYRKNRFEINDIEGIIRHKEVRYPIGGKYALKNLSAALEEFKAERSNVYYSEQVSREEILELLEKMDFDITQPGA